MTTKEELRPHADALAEDITRLCGQVIAKGMLGILEQCIEMQDRIAELERQNAELRKEKSMALGVMQELIDRIGVPEPNCSCHLSPPCGDCVDYGGIRETVDAAETLIAADQKGKAS